MSSNKFGWGLPPGVTDGDIDMAFGSPEGYEEFCEEFAGGDHDAAERLAKAVARQYQVRGFHDLAEDVLCDLFAHRDANLPDLCDALGVRRYYGAALADAWEAHNDRRP